MNNQKFLKKAVVLLLMVLMIVSSAAVGANTFTKKENTIQKQATSMIAPLRRDLVWDNVVGFHGSRGGIIVATVRTEGIAFPADDFELDGQKEVTSLFWQGGYFQCQLAQGQIDYHWDWRVLFWTDDGTGEHPEIEIYNQTIADADITREHWYNYTRLSDGQTYWVANYSADLPVPIEFDANIKYWITIQGIQIPNAYPQACWVRHNDTDGGIILHEAMIKAAYWGYPNWVTIQSLLGPGGDPDPRPHDLNFQLFGGDVVDETPPVTTATLDGDQSGDVYISDVTVTLTATDENSGVDYTKYKVDSGAWNIYTAPFVVSGNGPHTVTFYSVDKAGNTEDEKSVDFTIEYPIQLGISIKGGLGVSVAIKNIGDTDLTNIDWKVDLDGKLIFIGKTKSGTISSLTVGDEETIKVFVFGLGKTGIAVEAEGFKANTTGTALLFFVIGVK